VPPRDTAALRACLLGCFCTTLFLCVNFRKYSTDVVPIGLMPVSVLRSGTLNMDIYRPYYDDLAPGKRYTFVEVNGHLYPMKPFAISLVAVPFYAPPVLAGVPTLDTAFWIGWGRLLTAILAGAAVSLAYSAGRRWASERAAITCSLLLGLGTCYWTVIGQTLNYHVGGVLCVALIVKLLDGFPLSWKKAAAVGLLAGLAVGMRPTSVVLLFPLGIYLLLPGRLAGWKAIIAALVGVSIVPALNAWWNAAVFGSWSATGYSPEEVNRWDTPFGEGFVGQLIAPNSGLFAQSPFLLLALIGSIAAWRSSTIDPRGLLRAYSLCFLGYLAFFARWYDWQGGLTPAARMLCEGYPLLLPSILVGWRIAMARRWGQRLILAAAIWSIGWQLQGIAVFDAVVELDPPHDPWRIEKHFFWVHLNEFGAGATALAFGKTVGMFAAITAVFWMATRKMSKLDYSGTTV